MKNAKEMFEDLEYVRLETLNQIIYQQERQFLDFNKTSEKINIYMNGRTPYQGFQISDIKLFQAINKQVEELGWYK